MGAAGGASRMESNHVIWQHAMNNKTEVEQ